MAARKDLSDEAWKEILAWAEENGVKDAAEHFDLSDVTIYKRRKLVEGEAKKRRTKKVEQTSVEESRVATAELSRMEIAAVLFKTALQSIDDDFTVMQLRAAWQMATEESAS